MVCEIEGVIGDPGWRLGSCRAGSSQVYLNDACSEPLLPVAALSPIDRDALEADLVSYEVANDAKMITG